MSQAGYGLAFSLSLTTSADAFLYKGSVFVARSTIHAYAQISPKPIIIAVLNAWTWMLVQTVLHEIEM